MKLVRIPVELLTEVFLQVDLFQGIRIDISGYNLSYTRTVVRRSTKRPLSKVIARLFAGPTVRALVRKIHVFGRGGVHPGALRLLLSWIPEFIQLTSFSWDGDGSFPTTMLDSLGHHWSKGHLHTRTSFSKWHITDNWSVLKLAPNMLRSLQVCMPNSPYDRVGKEARMAKRKLFWVLKNSPGLQSLTTYAPQEHIEKRGHGPSASWHDVKLGFPLPQLLELSIADKPFEHHLSALSQIPQLTVMALRIQKPQRCDKHKSSLAAVKHAFQHMMENVALSRTSNLSRYTRVLNPVTGMIHGAQRHQWNAQAEPSLQATRSTHRGEKEPRIDARQIRGPSETRLEQGNRQNTREGAEKRSRKYLDAMPPAVLFQMIEANER
ncbi:MAG: hypothetical protein Q9175_002590 [Cornicularia normoerica]